jgi:chromosome segregation ATPase
MHHIESTKSAPKAQQQNALKQLEQIEIDLDLFKHIESELSVFNNTSKTYRDVVKKIEQLEDFRTRIERFIEMHQKTIDYVDEAISKVKQHIHEVEYENKVEVTYDEAYLRPMLDLAYVIFDIVKTEDGGVELKSKVKE